MASLTRNRNLDQRLNWFDRQFLSAQDLADEQDHYTDRRWRHGRLLHTPGVAEGLGVAGTVNASSVTVASGTALDPQGREIVLLTQRPVSLPAGTGTVEHELYITFREEPGIPSSAPGIQGMTRLVERPDFPFRRMTPTPDAVPTDGVLLAKVVVTNGALASSPDWSVRVRAGTYIADVTVDAVTTNMLRLRRVGRPEPEWPIISSSGSKQIALDSSLRLDAQREVLFQGAGQLRAVDDNHRLALNPQIDSLEIYERGSIRLFTGAPLLERMRIQTNGDVGIGTGGAAPNARLQVAGGAIMPAAGNTDASGVLFPKDPGGGAGDAAWIRYYPRTGQATTFELGTSNDLDDHIAFMASGNVGIGTNTPGMTLDVAGHGRMRVREGSNGSAGMWLYQSTPAADRAFIGMANNDQVGFYGAGFNNWGLVMNVTTANTSVGIPRVNPGVTLDVNGSLRLQNGSTVNELSTDGSLGDNSDSAIPTERAVRTYVDRRMVALTGDVPGIDLAPGGQDKQVQVNFGQVFAAPPVVLLSIKALDVHGGYNFRVDFWPDPVTNSGCTANFHSWADTIIYMIGLRWLAIGRI